MIILMSAVPGQTAEINQRVPVLLRIYRRVPTSLDGCRFGIGKKIRTQFRLDLCREIEAWAFPFEWTDTVYVYTVDERAVAVTTQRFRDPLILRVTKSYLASIKAFPATTLALECLEKAAD